MSTLSQFRTKAPGSFDDKNIGDTITIVTGVNPNTTYSNGDFVLVDRVYSQASYPLLFQRLGLITAANTTYNTATQFYVPNVFQTYPTIVGNLNYLSQAKLTTYMRAR
jgi:hypothetical protein